MFYLQTLKEFHADLQYYVVAVNYLEKIEVHSNAKFNWTARNDIFVRLFHQIKSLICEVEVGVNITDQTVAKRVPPNYPLKRGLAPHFENLTQMKLQDTGVVYKLRDFTRKWSNNLMKRLPTNRKRGKKEKTKNQKNKNNKTQKPNKNINKKQQQQQQQHQSKKKKTKQQPNNNKQKKQSQQQKQQNRQLQQNRQNISTS